MRQILLSITALASVVLVVIAVGFEGLVASEPDAESTMKQHYTAWQQERSPTHSRQVDPPRGLSRPAAATTGVTPGLVYTYRDGGRVVRVIQQDSLTIQPSGRNTADDVVLHRGLQNSIVERQPKHDSETLPVFRSESGGGLMTLPGGVLLALDPSWTGDEVQDFFMANGIATGNVSPLGFIQGGYMILTDRASLRSSSPTRWLSRMEWW